MAVIQAAALVNELYREITGKDDISTVDNSNIVEVGRVIQSITSVDNVYGKIFNKVGNTIVENKAYKSKFKGLFKTSSEYGSIIEFLRVLPFTVQDDPSRAPQSGTRYDSFLTYQAANVEAKYVENEDAFRLIYWRPSDQLWTAFNSMERMEKFLAAIEIEVQNAIEVRLEALASNAVAAMIAQTVYKSMPDGDYTGTGTAIAQNVLALFNATHPDATATVDDFMAMERADIVKFFTRLILDTKTRVQRISSIYNAEGVDSFVNEADLNLTVLDPIMNAMKVNIWSETFHKDLMSMGATVNTVPYWVGSGTAYDSGSISEVNVKIKAPDGSQHTVELANILACMYDKEAVICFNEHTKATSFYNVDIDATQIQQKYRAGYANLLDKVFIVFYAAE